tara:strand:+ start:911 stop:1447 length:537 start_codon:yes stop_codon:yes gene_type:complete
MEKKIIIFALIVTVGILGIFAYNNNKFDSHGNMMKMINFIEENTDLVYKGDKLPIVKINTQKEMCEVLFEIVPDPCNIAGYYNDETNEIVIGDKPTIHMVKEKFKEVILVHELVHFLQKTNGVYETIECRRALEQDAFKIQELYVEANDINPLQKPDPLFSMVISNCNTYQMPTAETH